MTGYSAYTFKFKDTLPAGLTFGEISSVKIGETALTKNDTAAPVDNQYTFTQAGQNLEISFDNFINYADKVGNTVEVVYTATLNDKAVTGMNPNTNKAIVEYSNDPSATTGGTEESEPSTADVHTFDFTIYKYYLQDSTKPDAKTELAGAKFELYKEDGTTKVKLKDLTGGNYRQATSEESSAEGFTSAVIVTDADGKVNVKGLEAGTYKLREIEAPDGFNKLSGDITVKITPTYDLDTGKLSKVDVEYTISGETATSSVTVKDTSPEIPVENKSGSILPNTGSTGTILFTLCGIAVVAVMFSSSVISKKRRNA